MRGDKSFENTKPALGYIAVSIKGHIIDALVDTGATTTVIDNTTLKFFQRRGIKVRRMKPYAAVTADGTKIWLTSFAEVEIELKDERHTIRLTLCPRLSVTMLLGVDFLTMFRIDLHFACRKWSFDRDPTTLYAFIGEGEELENSRNATELYRSELTERREMEVARHC